MATFTEQANIYGVVMHEKQLAQEDDRHYTIPMGKLPPLEEVKAAEESMRIAQAEYLKKLATKQLSKGFLPPDPVGKLYL